MLSPNSSLREAKALVYIFATNLAVIGGNDGDRTSGCAVGVVVGRMLVRDPGWLSRTVKEKSVRVAGVLTPAGGGGRDSGYRGY